MLEDNPYIPKKIPDVEKNGDVDKEFILKESLHEEMEKRALSTEKNRIILPDEVEVKKKKEKN
ncbi:hypothetical protein [Vagococcus sp.]|uniref:hypothetical protein n=1 Tax=Vagococcus sp. TaxID=1933889 RepID=UPI002FCA1A53